MEALKVFLVFPHQLFEVNFSKSKNFLFYLLEEPLFFSQYNFHQQKLLFHRASMKYYASKLTDLNYKIRYFNFYELGSPEIIQTQLELDGVEEVHYFDVVDDWLETKIKKEYVKNFKIHIHESPMFLCSRDILKDEFIGQEHLLMASFYISQRKRFGLLLHQDKPVGGKWSLDAENRKKLPKAIVPPEIYKTTYNQFVLEGMTYVKEYFSVNVGETESFNYAVTHEEARRCLNDFLSNRMELFGTYEDAISTKYPFVFHSILSPYLNSGLLTPDEVIVELINVSEGKEIPLNSLEGFIRQVIGWREFMRAVYIFKGRRIRTNNFWKHRNNMPSSFYSATTGVEPVDLVIKKILKHSYSHHIERLMVLGNFMQLCEINPDEVYQWFMEMYIDAYDWVMVPNVYSMSQYADGGLTTTKPYLSSSNYLLKMSDFKKGEWIAVWDALYWRFIHKHKDFFSSNPRLSVMNYHLNKMGEKQIKKHYEIAESFLEKLLSN